MPIVHREFSAAARGGRSQAAMLAVLLVVALAAVIVFMRHAQQRASQERALAEEEAQEAATFERQRAEDLARLEANKSLQFFDHAIAVADAQQKARSAGKDVLLYFTATWCGPCKAMKADVFPHDDVIEAINRRYVAVCIDIDARPDDAKTFDITGVPAFIITRNGQPLARKRGYQERADLVAWLNEAR